MDDALIYLLSPARCDGARARMLMNSTATFDLTLRLRSGDGAPLGDVFTFLSGLYFRGQLAYACASTPTSRQGERIMVITTDCGRRRRVRRRRVSCCWVASRRGDMSRSGLLLRHARSGVPLEYVPVAGAVRRGKRPHGMDPVRLTKRVEGEASHRHSFPIRPDTGRAL